MNGGTGSSASEMFYASVKQAAEEVLHYRPEKVLLVHHNDTDGLTSGAIMQSLFERLAVPLARYCLEKPYPIVMERLLLEALDRKRGLVVITDFGSGMLPVFSSLNCRKIPILVLDHHDIVACNDPYLRLVNPRAVGLPGDTHCSASAVCAHFAIACDARNTDLAKLGALGAIGDRMVTEKGEWFGPNRDLAERASASGDLIAHRGLWLRFPGDTVVAVDDLRGYLDALGSIDYFHGGPDIAIKGLLEGFDHRYVHIATKARERLHQVVQQMLLQAPREVSRDLQVLFTGAEVEEFGVKTIGLLCEAVANRGSPAPSYTLGFQRVKNEIPGLGILPINQVKLSMRVSDDTRAAISAGRSPSIRELLNAVSPSVGAFVDACHDYSGAATIAPGKEEIFIDAVAAHLRLFHR